MRLQAYKCERPNFGDDLNEWLWPRLLPGFFDDDPDTLFLGIGSIIGPNYPTAARKVVFGAGYVAAYLDPAPDVHGADWDVFFVRGPRTARALGLPDSLGIGDAAILVRAIGLAPSPTPGRVGFMPHWESVPRGNWQAACEMAGVRFIDPGAPVGEVIHAILGCRALVSEAMHGAIVADALRVPWVPLLPIDSAHRSKWLDWADALDLKLSRHRLWPSTPAEARLAAVRRPLLSAVARTASRKPLAGAAGRLTTYAAACRLSWLARQAPCLSRDSAIRGATDRMVEQLAQLRARYGKDRRGA